VEGISDYSAPQIPEFCWLGPKIPFFYQNPVIFLRFFLQTPVF